MRHATGAGWSGGLRGVKGICLRTGEEDLRGGEPLDDVHRPMAVWAQPEVGLLGGRGCHRRRLMEQSAAERKHLPASAVGQPAEVADAREASGQYMLEEASQELLRRERHGAVLAAMRIVLPPEGDLGVGDCL